MAALMDIVEKDRDFYETSGGGVTLSGGEVLAHGEYALEIAKEVKKAGIFPGNRNLRCGNLGASLCFGGNLRLDTV